MDSQEVLRFINDPANWYLSQDEQLVPSRTTAVSIDECIVYQVTVIQQGTSTNFDSMSNILDSMGLPGILFFYMVEGRAGSLAYYYGVSLDAAYYFREGSSYCLLEEAASVFEAVFSANYPLNTLDRLNENEKSRLKQQILSYSCGSIVEGVPGEFNERTNTLGADKVKQAMQNDNFILVELLKPLSVREDNFFATSILQVSTALESLANFTENCVISGSRTCNFNVGVGQLRSNSKIFTSNETRKEFRIADNGNGVQSPSAVREGGIAQPQKTPVQVPTTERVSQVLNGVLDKGILGEDSAASAPPQPLEPQRFATTQRPGRRISIQPPGRRRRFRRSQTALANTFAGPSIPAGAALASQFTRNNIPIVDGDFFINDLERQVGRGTNNTRLFTASNNIAKSRSSTNTNSRTHTRRMGDHNAINWNRYIDNLLYPRLDYGKATGLYLFSTGLFAQNRSTLIKLFSVLKYTYNSRGYNNIPMIMTDMGSKDIRWKSFAEFQLPMYECAGRRACFSQDEIMARATFSQAVTPKFAYGGNYLSCKELSSIIALPL